MVPGTGSGIPVVLSLRVAHGRILQGGGPQSLRDLKWKTVDNFIEDDDLTAIGAQRLVTGLVIVLAEQAKEAGSPSPFPPPLFFSSLTP